MGKRGPKPKPTPTLAIEGSLRQDRHKGRAKNPKPTGVPTPPDWLDKVAVDHWWSVVTELVSLKVAAAIDSHALALLCDAWSQYQRLRKMKPEDPIKHAYALNASRKSWIDIASRFGMTASDRTRIELDAETPEEAAEKFVV
jgi:phage terminase small subunit